MTVLSGASIRDLVESGDLRIDPEPDYRQYQPASVDIRLGGQMYDAFDDVRFQSRTFRLEPQRFYLGHTAEVIGLPNDVTAMIAGRSSVSRAGVVVHLTAGWCDPGFEGDLTLEIINFSNEVVTFEPGDRIGQLVCMQLDQPSEGYDGQYQGQRGPTEAGEI